MQRDLLLRCGLQESWQHVICGERGISSLLLLLRRVFGRQYPREAPVFGVDLIDDDVDVLRLPAEVGDKACGDVVDDCLLLWLGYGSLGDLDVDVWHGVDGQYISGLTSRMTCPGKLAVGVL